MHKRLLKISLAFFTICFLFSCSLLNTNVQGSSQFTEVTVTIKANVTAKVFISNLYKGYTPLSIKLGIGKYPLRLEANGYITFETVLEVKINGPTTFDFNLQPVSSTSTSTTSSGKKTKLKVTADIPCGVYSNGIKIGVTPLDIEIRPGTYIIKVVPMDKSYQPKEEKINISAGQVIELKFTFKTSPTTYNVTIQTNVPAQVILNGSVVGNTPLTLNLAAGNYNIGLNPLTPGFQPQQNSIIVSSNQVFNFTLQAISYNISINTNIPCTVIINNSKMGRTPLNINLAPGTYTVTLNPEVAGYNSQTQTITVTQPNQVFNFTLQAISYNISINTNIPCTVIINNSKMGRTPVNINLAPGTYTVTLNPEVAGYNSQTQTITVTQPNQVFNFTLQQTTGNIVFNIPNDAKVFINNQIINFKSSQPITLAPGTYTIRIDYHGLTITKTITIVSGQTITISLALDILIN